MNGCLLRMESIAQGYPGYNISGGHYTAKKSQEERLDSLASIIYIGVTDTLSRCISGDGTEV